MSITNSNIFFYQGLAERLKIVRKELKFTQQQAADFGKVTVQSWRNYEAGRAEPKISALYFMAEKNISLSWLLTGNDQMKTNNNNTAPDPEAIPKGIIEEWVKDVREKEGNDGRIVMELSLQVQEFREWYKEKKSKSNEVEVSLPHKNVA